MIRIEVKEENGFHHIELEARLIGYDKAVDQLSALFTTLYKQLPEKILAQALYQSEWGQHIDELTKD